MNSPENAHSKGTGGIDVGLVCLRLIKADCLITMGVQVFSVQASAASSRDVGYESAWRQDRRALARLLARAPRLLSTRG